MNQLDLITGRGRRVVSARPVVFLVAIIGLLTGSITGALMV
jgi:hypothetical protein